MDASGREGAGMDGARIETGRVTLPGRGVAIEYEWHGARERRGARPFVLVHGFTGSRDDWFEHLPALGALGPTLALDQRGHGGSTNLGDPAAYSLEHLVDDLAALLTELGVASCDLLGHSMGGGVAMQFALAHPERVHSLVLMDTSARALRLDDEGVFEKVAVFLRNAGAQGLSAVLRRRAAGDAQVPASARAAEARMGSDRYWQRIEAKHRALDPAALIGLGRALVSAPSVIERLGAIRCPTLVIVGAEDAPFRRTSEEMAAAIPGARLVVVPDAAHSPQIENPEVWFDAIRAHLERARAHAPGAPSSAG
jgi:pimeloyl-ACP methyl ester carboxylesterase